MLCLASNKVVMVTRHFRQASKVSRPFSGHHKLCLEAVEFIFQSHHVQQRLSQLDGSKYAKGGLGRVLPLNLSSWRRLHLHWPAGWDWISRSIEQVVGLGLEAQCSLPVGHLRMLASLAVLQPLGWRLVSMLMLYILAMAPHGPKPPVLFQPADIVYVRPYPSIVHRAQYPGLYVDEPKIKQLQCLAD